MSDSIVSVTSNTTSLQKHKKLNKMYRQRYAYIMLLPALICTLIFSYFPLSGWIMAFTDYKVGKSMWSAPWAGLKQFKYFFLDSGDAFSVIRNTVVMNVFSILIGLGTAFFFAILLNEVKSHMVYKYTDASLDSDLGNTEFEIWDNRNFEPHLIVINLGTNDASYTKDMKERVDQFTLGYYKLLEQVRECNPDSVIICSFGVMGQDLCSAIESAVTTFKAMTGDQRIHTLVFDVQLESDGIGSDWHPNLISHDKASKKLIGKIKEVMDWCSIARIRN